MRRAVHSEIAVLMCRMNDVLRLTVTAYTAYAHGQLRLAVMAYALTVTVSYGLRTTTFHLERGELKESIVK